MNTKSLKTRIILFLNKHYTKGITLFNISDKKVKNRYSDIQMDSKAPIFTKQDIIFIALNLFSVLSIRKGQQYFYGSKIFIMN